MLECGEDGNVPVVGLREFLLTILQETLQTLYPLVSCEKFAFRDSNLLLERRVLFDELALHVRELLEVALEEGHLLLLSAVVAAAKNVVVLFASLIKGDFKFNNL